MTIAILLIEISRGNKLLLNQLEKNVKSSLKKSCKLSVIVNSKLIISRHSEPKYLLLFQKIIIKLI